MSEHQTTIWPRWLRALFGWKTVRDTGCWLYEQNRVTGARRIRRAQSGGYQPVDMAWIREPRA